MPIIGKKHVLDGIKLTRDPGVFYDIYVKQKKNVWFPEEINVQLDTEDYLKMADEEKALFHRLIAYFVPTELLVQNVLGESFYPYIMEPRAKMAMTAQMFMEDIHSDFFEMIMNSFSMDHEALYNIAETDPLIKRKHEMVAKYANAISVSQGGVDPDTVAGKRAILMAILINNIIQEGLWFYSGFAMFFAMRETGRMRNVCNGIDLVLIDESFHLQLGIELVLGIIDESPEVVADEQFVANVKQALIDGTELELEFLQSLLRDVSLFHVNYAEMAQYLKFITDRRLEELGFEAHYCVEKNPLKFLEKQDLLVLQNFFEVTPNQYTNY